MLSGGGTARSDICERLGLRPIINVSGTMTALGASIVVPAAVRAVAEVLPEFVEINDLHRKASAVVARLTGAEAGFITASASAGITLAVAACMTGSDLGRIEQLPAEALRLALRGDEVHGRDEVLELRVADDHPLVAGLLGLDRERGE